MKKTTENEAPWTWQEVIMELFKDEKFLDLANRIINTWKEIQQARVTIEEKRLSGWESVSKVFIICRFILSFFALAGLGFALKERILPVELAGLLLGAVIFSLFIPPKTN